MRIKLHVGKLLDASGVPGILRHAPLLIGKALALIMKKAAVADTKGLVPATPQLPKSMSDLYSEMADMLRNGEPLPDVLGDGTVPEEERRKDVVRGTARGYWVERRGITRLNPP